MSEATVRDLRNRGGHVLDRVLAGERVTITRDGRPVARLEPVARVRLGSGALVERFRNLPEWTRSGCGATLTRRSTSSCDDARGRPLDTNIVVLLGRLRAQELPDEPMISVITLAELSVGPLVTDDPDRARGPAGVVVGATFVGPQVGELLHAATIAIVGSVPLDVLWHAVPAFPTVSEVWLRLLEADRGR